MKLSGLFFLSIALCLQACTKEVPVQPSPETGIVTDVQGNTYKTVKIGNAWWMAENLRVTTFNDSTPLREIPADSVHSWRTASAPAYCRLDDRYGVYYNWFTLGGAGQLAPTGWHVASDDDWMQLEKTLGMRQEECEATGWRGGDLSAQLLPEASVGWPGEAQAKVYGTNSSGFSALPGGCRLFNGGVGDVSAAAYFWCSTARTASTAWYRNLSANHSQLYRYSTYNTYGFSIRCVRDQP